MSTSSQNDGKNFQPIKEAAVAVSYSRDYVTRLAREQKIRAKHVGRKWLVDIDSLRLFAESALVEQEIRKRQLSEDRKLEAKVREAVDEKKSSYEDIANKLHKKSMIVASLVLSFGVVSGGLSHHFLLKPITDSQVASVGSLVSSAPEGSLIEEEVDLYATDSGFSQSKHSIGKIENGLLLLPDSDKDFSPQEMFSDTVAVKETADGSSVVKIVNEFGETVGDEIPFVVVPVGDFEI